MNPFDISDALAAHQRFEAGRRIVNLHDGPLFDQPGSEPAPKKPRKPRTPKPIDWKAESAALRMPIGVLRDRHPETIYERRTRLAAWRAMAIAERMEFERFRRKTVKHIAYLRKRLQQGTA